MPQPDLLRKSTNPNLQMRPWDSQDRTKDYGSRESQRGQPSIQQTPAEPGNSRRQSLLKAIQPSVPGTFRVQSLADHRGPWAQQSTPRNKAGILVDAKNGGGEKVDTSGRRMSITNFAGSKIVASPRDLYIRRGSILQHHDSLQDLQVDAQIQAWRETRRHSQWKVDAESLIQQQCESFISRKHKKKIGKKGEDEDAHYVLSQMPPSRTGDRSFMKGMLEPQQTNASIDVSNDLEVSEELIAALKTPPKDRQYEELELIIDFMDSLTGIKYMCVCV